MRSIWEDTREGTYESFAEVKDCYDALTDDLSRRVFLARMAFDLGEWDGYLELIRCSGLMPEEEIHANFAWVDEFARTQKPVYIYGAGQFGGHTCRMLQRKHVNIAGFFDRNATNIGTRCGLPVRWICCGPTRVGSSSTVSTARKAVPRISKCVGRP